MYANANQKSWSVIRGLWVLVGALALTSVVPALGGGKVTSNVCYTSAYAWATAIGDSDTDSESYYTCKTADAYASASGSSGSWGKCYAWAKSFGKVGGWAYAGNGGNAGPEQPFGVLLPDSGIPQGFASVELDSTFSEQSLGLSGAASYNTNGFFEIAVLDATGLSEADVTVLGSLYPSVEAALNAGALDPARVLGHWRESDFASSGVVALDLNLASVKPEHVFVSLVIHAISPQPENIGAPSDGRVDGSNVRPHSEELPAKVN